MDTAALARLGDTPADWRFRGLPTAPSVAAVAATRPRLFTGGFPSPVMVVVRSALEHNIAAMAGWCRRRGVLLAPHGKTTMAPQIFARQLAAGAWGMTAATPSHVRTYRAFGVARILLANQLVDPAAVAWLAEELHADPGFEFWCYVDSVAGVELLAGALADAPREVRLGVLVELGTPGGRTGCRTVEQAVAVAGAAAATPRLAVAGVAGYDGALGNSTDDPSLARVSAFLAVLREAAQRLIDGGLVDADRDGIIVSAGGSVFFDEVAAALTGGWRSPRPVSVVLRSGSYAAHDSGLYDRVSPFRRNPDAPSFRHALEVWGRVLSTPEEGLAVIDVGRRDAPDDQGCPVPLLVRSRDGATAPAHGLRVTALNDQHGFVAMPAGARLAPGDWVGLGISHPCTAFDRWNLLVLVDDDYNVVDSIRTFF